MRKKKIEKLVFNLLLLLPLISFGFWLLCCVVRNNNGSFDLSGSLVYEKLISFISLDFLGGFLYEPINYFLNLFSVPVPIANCLSMYINYMIVIELLMLLYDIIIFIPRCCRSIVEKGM